MGNSTSALDLTRPNTKGVQSLDTLGDPTVSLTAEEYMALDFAAGMLRERAEQLDEHYAALAGACRNQAAVLQRLHDRWHAQSVLATEGHLHDVERCGCCRNGGAL